jgi:hypothetical protein
MDVIATVWFWLTRADGLRPIIAATQGTVEIATKLWLLDDAVPSSGPQYAQMPCVAAALDALLVNRPANDRALAAAGGKPDVIAKIALSRLRSALTRTPLDPADIVFYVHLTGHLARDWDHPLRYGLLQAGAISLCTRTAGAIGRALSAGGNRGLLDGLFGAFAILINCLESTEGFTWVAESFSADLLVAFADCSPHFARLDEEDRDSVCTLFSETLPPYLVYRSVVQAVHAGMGRLQATHLKRLDSSIVREVWIDFRARAEERHVAVVDFLAAKNMGATCDNVQVQYIYPKFPDGN